MTHSNPPPEQPGSVLERASHANPRSSKPRRFGALRRVREQARSDRGRSGRGWWERPLAAICRRVAQAAKVIDDLQRLPPPLILPDGAEVSRRRCAQVAREPHSTPNGPAPCARSAGERRRSLTAPQPTPITELRGSPPAAERRFPFP